MKMDDNWQVEEVRDRAQLDAISIFLTEHADSGRLLFFPVFDGRRDACIKEIQERLWAEHTGDPGSRWVFVREPSSTSKNGDEVRVVGACQWRFYEGNPFPKGMPGMVATWWPEGGGREFVNEFMVEVMRPRVAWMSRPHVGMSWMAVHKDYRRRNIGTALMAWGTQRADEMGLEIYIEATPLGALLYTACGYAIVARVDFNMKPQENADEARAKLERVFVPFDYACTWRPVRGIWLDDEPAKTWTARLGNSGAHADGILIRESVCRKSEH